MLCLSHACDSVPFTMPCTVVTVSLASLSLSRPSLFSTSPVMIERACHTLMASFSGCLGCFYLKLWLVGVTIARTVATNTRRKRIKTGKVNVGFQVNRADTDPLSPLWQGSREYTPQQVVEQLGLASKMPARKGGPGQPALPMPASPGSRFILPISECEFTVNAVLDELQRDVFPTLSEHRPSRCTGTALQVCACI